MVIVILIHILNRCIFTSKICTEGRQNMSANASNWYVYNTHNANIRKCKHYTTIDAYITPIHAYIHHKEMKKSIKKLEVSNWKREESYIVGLLLLISTCLSYNSFFQRTKLSLSHRKYNPRTIHGYIYESLLEVFTSVNFAGYF